MIEAPVRSHRQASGLTETRCRPSESGWCPVDLPTPPGHFSAVKSLLEIEEAIAELPADARRQLVHDLLALCPDAFPADGWDTLLLDGAPRPALTSLIDQLDIEVQAKARELCRPGRKIPGQKVTSSGTEEFWRLYHGLPRTFEPPPVTPSKDFPRTRRIPVCNLNVCAGTLVRGRCASHETTVPSPVDTVMTGFGSGSAHTLILTDVFHNS